MVKVKEQGPKTSIPVDVEADTGASITAMKAEILQELDWVELEPTDVHIRGYSVIAEPCLGKATIDLRIGKRYQSEDVFSATKQPPTSYREMPVKHLESSLEVSQMSR